MDEQYKTLLQMPLEELILLGVCGVHYHSYITPDIDKYFDIQSMLKFTKDIETLEDFENNYSVDIINLVLDGENDA